MKTALLSMVIASLFIHAAAVEVEGDKHHKKGDHGKDVNTCKQHFNVASGTIRYHNSSDTVPPDTSCDWYIAFVGPAGTKPEDHKIFLVFDELYLDEGDKIEVLNAEDNSTLVHFDPFIYHKNETGAIAFLTGKSNITVKLRTTTTVLTPLRKFQMKYYSNSECNYTFEHTTSGIFQSPLYDSMNFTTPVNCSFKFIMNDKDNNKLNLWLTKYAFNHGSLSIHGSEYHDGTFDANDFTTDEFLAPDVLTLDMLISNHSVEPQQFIVKYDAVHPACSFTEQVTHDGLPKPLPFPNTAVMQSIMASQVRRLTCLWIVECETDNTITVNLKNVSLPEPMDQLLILDGPNRTSPVLVDIGVSSNDHDRAVYSTGSKLWIYASSPFVNENFKIDIEVLQTKSGGHMKNQGTLDAKNEDSTTFLLEVPADQQAKFIFDEKTTSLKDMAVVSFYSDYLNSSKPFFTLSPQQKFIPVVSPTHQMAIVTQAFKTSEVRGSFLGVEKGCYELGHGSGDTYSVNGHCNKTCAWLVQLDSESYATGDILGFHFPILNLSANDFVLVRKLDLSQTLLANVSSGISSLPDLWIPAAEGALVQVTRSTCTFNSTVIKASYLVNPKCESMLTPQQNESLTISSPGYPNHYPLGATCNWTIAKPSGSVFLHVTLKDLQLATKGHMLKLYSVSGQNKSLISEFNGDTKTLPDDIPVATDLYVEFSTSTDLPLVSLPGFQMTVTVVDFGSSMSGPNGSFSTPDYPKPVSNGSFFAWIVNVASSDKQKEIIEFHFDNKTSLTDINKNLKIYDGASLRSHEINNFTSQELLSRNNVLIFVYQRNLSNPGSPFSLGYHNHSCNMSLICENGICMHDDWHCNGVNDCGDFSDERNCEGGLAPTPPPPSPEPSKDGTKGVSTAILLSTLFSSLVVGIVLGVVVPMAYQRYRARQFSTYTSLNS